MMMLSAFAAGSSAGSTILGSTALRVGWLTAKNACCTANSDSSAHTLVIPTAACTQNSPLVAISPTVVQMRMVRRSKTSARAPPYRPNTTSGTSPKRPVRPTYADDPVIE
jgi:hypothetical protein